MLQGVAAISDTLVALYMHQASSRLRLLDGSGKLLQELGLPTLGTVAGIGRAARLQAATSSEQPILLRLETKAGHGAGKPRSKILDELSDVWSFIFWQLGMRT